MGKTNINRGQWVQAHRAHTCFYCHEFIEAGTRYWRCLTVAGGLGNAYHASCLEAARAVEAGERKAVAAVIKRVLRPGKEEMCHRCCNLIYANEYYYAQMQPIQFALHLSCALHRGQVEVVIRGEQA